MLFFYVPYLIRQLSVMVVSAAFVSEYDLNYYINAHVYIESVALLYLLVLYYYTDKVLSFVVLLFDCVSEELNYFPSYFRIISRFQCLFFKTPTKCLKKKAISQLPKVEDLITIYMICYTLDLASFISLWLSRHSYFLKICGKHLTYFYLNIIFQTIQTSVGKK